MSKIERKKGGGIFSCREEQELIRIRKFSANKREASLKKKSRKGKEKGQETGKGYDH